MPHTIESLKSEIDNIPKSKLVEQLYLTGFKKTDCNYENLHLTWATDPLSKDYFSPLNPCFTYEPRTKELLNTHPCWLVRDGALSLLDALNSTVFHDLDCTLIFNKELQPLLPMELQISSLFYDLVSRNPYTDKTKKVLLYTLVNGAYCSPEFFEQSLIKARESRPDLAEEDFVVLMLMRENQFYQISHDDVHPAFEFPRILKKIIPKATIISENQFDMMSNFNSWSFFDIQESCLVIGDNFLNHHLLSLKAQPLFEVESTEGAIHYNLSPNHAMRLLEPVLPADKSIAPHAKPILKVLKENEDKIKTYWSPPYAEKITFGCFYEWLREQLNAKS